MRRLRSFVALLLILALTTAAQVGARTYRDPEGAFTIELPAGWGAEREQAGDSWNTVISSDKHAGKLAILSIRAAPEAGVSDELRSRMLVGSSQPFFEGWLKSLKGQARVEKTGKVYRTTVGGVEALRMDVTYYRGDENDPRTGYAAYLFGRTNTLFISLTGSGPGVAALERLLATIKIEP